jgi:hypothetical protein
VAALGTLTEMGSKQINMKQLLAFVGVIFLIGSNLPQQKPREAPGESHLTVPRLMYAMLDARPPATNSSFLDNINLSFDPPFAIPAPDLNGANRSLRTDLPTGSFDPLQPRPGRTPKPGFTVADRKLNYQLLGSGGFAFKLNLTPAYPYPEASIPTGLDPGLGISIKF